MKKFVAIVFSLALAFSLSGFAFAKDTEASSEGGKQDSLTSIEKKKDFIKKIKNDTDFKIIADDGDGNYSFTVSEQSKKTKDEIQAKIDQYEAQTTRVRSVHGSGMSTYYSNSYVGCAFDSALTYTYGTGYNETLVVNGASSSKWYGANPYYASSIDQSDTWNFSCIAIGLDITYPPSMTVSENAAVATCTYPTLTGNYYQYTHSFSNVKCTSYLIFGVTESDSATYRFGADTVTANCSSYQSA